MIRLTKQLKDDFGRLQGYLDWLMANVGPMTLNKLNVTQGRGWMLVRTIQDGDSYYEFRLYFDDSNTEVMFKLACL